MARFSRKTNLRRFAAALFAFLAALVLCPYQLAWAIDTTWIFDGSGNWSESAKWSNGVPIDETFNVFVDDGDSAATVTLNTTTAIGGLSLGANDTLRIESLGSATAALTSANALTNDGSILLGGSGSGLSRLTVTSGALMNGSAGLLHFQSTGTDSRSLVGDLTNSGTVLVDRGTTFSKTGGTYTNSGQFTVATGQTLSVTGGSTFSQTAGTLDVQGTFDMIGGNFKYLGGAINGTPSLSGVALTIDTTAPASFLIKNNSTLVLPNGVLASDQSIKVQGTTLASTNGISNDGSILLSTNFGSSAGLNLQNNTLVNRAEGLLHFQSGGFGTQSFHGDLTNYGTVIVDQGTWFAKSLGVYSNSGQFTVSQSVGLDLSTGMFEQLAGTLDIKGTFKPMKLRYLGGTIFTPGGAPFQMGSGELTIGPDATSPIEFMLDGGGKLSGSIQAGQKVTMRTTAGFPSVVTSPTTLTNNGVIFVLAGSSGSAEFRVTEGQLVNGATGVLRFEPGGAGALTFRGDLTNSGTVQINKSTTFLKSAGNYVSSGSFIISSGQTLSFWGSSSFEQSGGSLNISGTMNMNSIPVSFDQTGGTINLNAGGTMALGSGTFKLSDGTFNVAGNMNMTDGVFEQSGGTLNVTGNMSITGNFKYLGGTITGSPRLTGSPTGIATLSVGAGPLNPASFTLTGNSLLAPDSSGLPAGVTINVGNSGNAAQLIANGFTNHGSILFKPTNSTHFLTLLAGTLVNGPTGLIHFENTTGSARFDGDLHNQGTVLLDSLTPVFSKSGGHHVNAGQFTVKNNFSITGGGIYEQTAGSTLVNGTMTVSAPIQLSGGQLTGRGTIVAPVENLAATVSPGDTVGTLNIQGAYTQHSDGILNIGLSGVAAGQFDVLNVTSSVTLDGTLNVQLLGGYVPVLGASFDILNWTTLTGTFETVNLPPLVAGLFWNKSQLYATGTLSVTNVLHGDFDGDGDVDGADFIVWQTNFPATSGHVPLTGDADADGDVDGADFSVWQTNFPHVPGPGSSPVPEPSGVLSGLVGFVLAAATLVCRKRR